jgi:hypothetical protein
MEPTKILKSGKPAPPNIGKKWEPNELQKLLDNVQSNLSITEIALAHGRTEGGIRQRLRDMAYEMYLSGENIINILLKTGITRNELNDKIKRMKSPENNAQPVEYAAVKNVDNYSIQEMQSDIAEIKSDIKRIFELLKGLELA